MTAIVADNTFSLNKGNSMPFRKLVLLIFFSFSHLNILF